MKAHQKKLMLPWTFLVNLLTSTVIYYLNFLHGKEVVQYLLNYKYHKLHRPHFRKLLRSSTKKSNNFYSPLNFWAIFNFKAL